jgi:hypothetical protein
MTSGTGQDKARSELPVACTLNQAELGELGMRWAKLAADARTERTQTKDGLRIVFRASPEAERELRALVAVERDCCAWASWSVEQRDDRLELVVRAAGEGVGALHGMFTG